MSLGATLAERGYLPDSLVRYGIRRLDRKRLRAEDRGSPERNREAAREFAARIAESPIALHTREANEQHYELPPAFFARVLGPRMKYSGCYWPSGVSTLGAAEEAMLSLTCRRAEIADGMEVLELGCGWGSLTLWIAERYPRCRVLAVSNSAPQRLHIEAAAAARGFGNVEVRTADMNDFDPGRRFDRVVSVEMFEHMRNWPLLMRRIASWLNDGGKLFVHIFSHARLPYLYEPDGDNDWMGRYFFTGGMMPSDDLLLRFQEHLVAEDHWVVDGTHYRKTAEAWLENLDRCRDELLPVLASVYGEGGALLWFRRWRIFFLACAELWGYDGGREWVVSHYRFVRRG